MIQKLKLLQQNIQNHKWIIFIFTIFCLIFPFMTFGNISFYIWNGDLLAFEDFFWVGFYSIVLNVTIFHYCNFLRKTRFILNILNLYILVSCGAFATLMQGIYGLFIMFVISIIPFSNIWLI